MGFTFYPIENDTVLREFRQRLSPFMMAIQKTTKSGRTSKSEIKSICDEVINAARSYNSGESTSDQLSADWYRYIQDTSNNTLEKEHDKLIAANLE